jgi:hypothetical protein
MTNSPSGLASDTNVVTGPVPSADANQIILKEIAAKWGKFSEHELSSLKNADDLLPSRSTAW